MAVISTRKEKIKRESGERRICGEEWPEKNSLIRRWLLNKDLKKEEVREEENCADLLFKGNSKCKGLEVRVCLVDTEAGVAGMDKPERGQ